MTEGTTVIELPVMVEKYETGAVVTEVLVVESMELVVTEEYISAHT